MKHNLAGDTIDRNSLIVWTTLLHHTVKASTQALQNATRDQPKQKNSSDPKRLSAAACRSRIQCSGGCRFSVRLSTEQVSASPTRCCSPTALFVENVDLHLQPSGHREIWRCHTVQSRGQHLCEKQVCDVHSTHRRPAETHFIFQRFRSPSFQGGANVCPSVLSTVFPPQVSPLLPELSNGPIIPVSAGVADAAGLVRVTS